MPPPEAAPAINELMNYLWWAGTIIFTIGLIWGFVRWMGIATSSGPAQEAPRKYIALVIVAGILMSSAAALTNQITDTNAPGSGFHGSPDRKPGDGKF